MMDLMLERRLVLEFYSEYALDTHLLSAVGIQAGIDRIHSITPDLMHWGRRHPTVSPGFLETVTHMAPDQRWGLSRATLAVGIPMQPPAYFLSHVVAKPAGLV